MTYRVILGRKAEKELKELPTVIMRRIDAHLLRLSDEPYPKGATKLKGKLGEGWRIRVGDYRILYTIDSKSGFVKIYHIGHRRQIYR